MRSIIETNAVGVLRDFGFDLQTLIENATHQNLMVFDSKCLSSFH